MLVIFSFEEYKVVIEAQCHEQAWDFLLEYENNLLKEAQSGDKQYSSLEELKNVWKLEGSTKEGIVEFEHGEIVYV